MNTLYKKTWLHSVPVMPLVNYVVQQLSSHTLHIGRMKYKLTEVDSENYVRSILICINILIIKNLNDDVPVRCYSIPCLPSFHALKKFMWNILAL